MEKDILKSLVHQIAVKHGLNVKPVMYICEATSDWNPWKVEYDGMFYVSHLAPLVENRVLTNLTEARARAFRWGLMGILGHRARLAGYEGPLAQLLEPGVGLDIGCRLLKQMFSSPPIAEENNPINRWRVWQMSGR